MTPREVLLYTLRVMKSKGPRYPEQGICRNVAEYVEEVVHEITIMHDVLDALTDLMVSWPKYSGDEDYPVPGGRDAYLVSSWDKTLWARYEHEYGALRWELLDWLIETLEKDNKS